MKQIEGGGEVKSVRQGPAMQALQAMVRGSSLIPRAVVSHGKA